MSAVVINGGLVHYEAFGRGKPVVFIHGWFGSWRYWMRTMEALAPDYRTYALDLWGFGDSDKSKQRYAVADYTSLIYDFLDQMGIANTSLVGHSLGAIVGLQVAIQQPTYISRLAAISLPITPDAVNSRLRDYASDSVRTRMFLWRHIAHKEVQQEAEKAAENVVSLSVQSALAVDTQTLVEQVRQPTLLVYGERDSVIDPHLIGTLNGRRPDLRPIGLAASKHFPMLEEANKFNRLLKDFLESGNDLTSLELKEEWKRRTR